MWKNKFAIKIGNAIKAFMKKKMSGLAAKASGASANAIIAASKKLEHVSPVKIGGAVLQAQAADELLEVLVDMPVIKEVIGVGDWIENFRADVRQWTIYKIPLIGDLFKAIDKGSNELFARAARAVGLENFAREAEQELLRIDGQHAFHSDKEGDTMRNAKEWFLNLGKHIPFDIPAGYPDGYSVPVATGSNLARVTEVILKGQVNFNPDNTQTVQRMNQLFTLLKGIRGLSQVNYTITDIHNYLKAVYTLEGGYFRLSKAIKYAKTYLVTKSKWPTSLIAKAGFNPNDFTANLAQYENFHLQLQNALEQMPIIGQLWDEIKYTNLVNIADSNDELVATIYTYDVSSQAYVDATHTLDNGESNQTYASFITKYQTALAYFMAYDKYQLIMGDMIGAFGASAMKDYTIDLSPIDITKTYDEVALSVIQNTVPLMMDGSIYRPATTGDNPTPAQTYAIDHVEKYGLHVEGSVDPSVSYADTVTKSYIAYFQISSANSTTYHPEAGDKVMVPATSGLPAQQKVLDDTLAGDFDVDALCTIPVNLQKYKVDEGEALELLKHTARLTTAKYYAFDGDTQTNKVGIAALWKTNILPIYTIEAYAVSDAGSAISTSIRPRAVIDSGSLNAAALLNDIFKDIQMWSQADWAPRISYAIGNGTSTAISKFAIWDLNVVGLLGSYAQDLAIMYTTYSMYAAKIDAAGKNIDNIRDIFNDRDNPKGNSGNKKANKRKKKSRKNRDDKNKTQEKDNDSAK